MSESELTEGVTKLLNVSKSLADKIDLLAANVARSKRVARLLGIVVVIVVLLAGGGGYLAVQNHDNATANTRAEVAQCQEGNTTRLQDIAIWNKLLALPANATAAQKAEVSQLTALVKVKDTPKNCAVIYGTSK